MSIRRSIVATQQQVGGAALFRTIRERIEPEWVEAALSDSSIPLRRRKMPAEVVVWLVVGACLFADMSFLDVMRHFGLTAPTRRGGEQVAPSSGAVAEARRRVGGEAMARVLRASVARWLAETDTERFHGLRVFAADGVTFRLPDTPSNDSHFGRPSTDHGSRSAWPQARAVCLVDVHTHMVVDAEVGAYRRVEIPLFDAVVPRVPDRTITVLDRGFRSFGSLHRLRSVGDQRHWLVRAWKGLKYKVVEARGNGDEIVTVRPGYYVRAADPTLPRELKARLVTFQAGRTTYRCLTSLVDPSVSAGEIADLYGRRWEAELVLDDVKTEQRGASPTLRSKTPDGVLQEIFGLFLGHNVVRLELARAAQMAGLPPRRISFHRGLAQVRHFMHFASGTTAPGKLLDRETELRDALRYLTLPERRSSRWYPRVLKSTIPKYPRKKIAGPAQLP